MFWLGEKWLRAVKAGNTVGQGVPEGNYRQ